MIGVIVNAISVIIGSIIGLLCRKGIPERYSDAIMKGLSLCVIYIGFSGSLCGENTIAVILSVVLGTAIGTVLNIDGFFSGLGERLEKGMKRFGSGGGIARGFVSASLLFCVGSMTIVGSLTAGLSGDNEMLFTKSALDFISAVMLTVSLGVGVMFSSAFILIFQGSIALLADVLSPFLSTAMVNEIICTGSLLIIGIGFNMLGITKLKVADYLPAIFLVPFVLLLVQRVPFLS